MNVQSSPGALSSDVCDFHTRRLAAEGVVEAMVTLAAALSAKGRTSEAASVLRQAAHDGHGDALYWLGHLILDLDPAVGDQGEAIAALSRAAEAGHRHATLRLAIARLSGLDEGPEHAIPALRSLADTGDAEASHLLGVCLTWGTGAPRDLDAAEVYLTRASSAGHPLAEASRTDLARVRQQIEPPVVSPQPYAPPKPQGPLADLIPADIGDYHTRRLAAEGDGNAVATLAASLSGAGRYHEAASLLRCAAAMQQPAAQYWLGHLILDLDPVAGTRGEAFSALLRASDAGHSPAAMRLAMARLAGEDGGAEAAVPLLRRLAAGGDAHALHLLGICQTWGTGVARDLDAARETLLLAQQQGVDVAAGLADVDRVRAMTPPPPEPTLQIDAMRFGPGDPLARGPQTVTIEITTRCNLACVMCPHGLPNGMLNKRDAPDALVTAILKATETIDEIHPTGVGEPMMADGFWRIVDAIAGLDRPRLVFHTNGVLLTERNVERLTRASISRVNVSVDAADSATYRRIRGADMRKTTDGIARLVKALEPTAPLAHHRIAMSMVLMRENIAEASDFVRLAHSLGVRSVYFEHLTEPQIPRGEWTVQRGNFTFQYAEQALQDEPDFADAHMLRAFDVADELGVVIEGHEVLLSSSHAPHEQRPCRTGAHPPLLG